MIHKIAVCDDNSIDRDYVIRFVKEWAKTQKKLIEIHSFLSAEQFLFQYEEEKDYDILILDIEMEKMNGVSQARKIRQENQRIQILFVTGYSDYMAEGYEVDALHYLMKPVVSCKLFQVMDKAIGNLKKTENVLFLQINNEMIKLVVKDIDFIEVFSHFCTIHTTHGDFETKIPISELENKLLRFLLVY